MGYEKSSVVPDLVRLHELGRDIVHELELWLERGIERDERAVAILPVGVELK